MQLQHPAPSQPGGAVHVYYGAAGLPLVAGFSEQPKDLPRSPLAKFRFRLAFEDLPLLGGEPGWPLLAAWIANL